MGQINKNVFFSLLIILILGTEKVSSKENLILGKFNLDSKDNFNNYLKELGVGFILRNLAGLADPDVTISRNCEGGKDEVLSSPSCTWNIQTDTTFRSHSVSFKLDSKVNDKTMDGREVTSVYKLLNDNTIIETQTGKDGKVTVLTRTFSPAGMTVDLVVNSVKATSVFKRV